MNPEEKLKRIRELCTEWDEQPDPEAGQGDSPEAADVLYDIIAVLDDTVEGK